MRLSTRAALAASMSAVVALLVAWAASSIMPAYAAYALALLIAIPLIVWGAFRIERYVARSMSGLDDGLRAFRDSDFAMRLATAGEDEVANVKRVYNDVADVLRAQRADVYQKELMLDMILQRTPVAVLLINAADRIVYSNSAARELFSEGRRMDGHRFRDFVEKVAEPLREVLVSHEDALVTVPGADQDETIHVAQRGIRINTQEHRLVLVERLTAELRRQEVSVWKKAIRVLNHELNNTVAPISSLVHSAKLAQSMPDRRHRLEEIYETIEERLAYLKSFLESYAKFARLPTPKKEPTRWEDVLADVRALYDFRVEGDPREEAMIDRAQFQQVLINLVKNAHESGSDPDDVVVAIQRVPDGTVVRVCDSGRGMAEDVMRQALLPFYSTKPGGSGVGLALCNEIVEAHGGRMRLQRREEGGTVVTCWVPSTRTHPAS